MYFYHVFLFTMYSVPRINRDSCYMLRCISSQHGMKYEQPIIMFLNPLHSSSLLFFYVDDVISMVTALSGLPEVHLPSFILQFGRLSGYM